MHKIYIPQRDHEIQFPECIEEMNRAQYLDFSELAYQFSKGTIHYEEFKIRLTYKLLNLKRKVNFSELNDRVYRVSENIDRIATLMDSFFTTKREDNKQFKSINLECVQNKLPEICVGWSKWIGPSDGLTSLSFGQYIQALNAFHDYSNTKEEKDLDVLVACLYLPKSSTFDIEKIDKRVEKCAGIPIGVKYGVYLFFAACQQWIVLCKELNIGGGNMVDLSVLFSKNKVTTNTKKGIGMLAALYNLAETQVFGDIDKTSNQKLFDVLIYMVQKHNEMEKLKRDAKHTKTKELS